MDVMCDIISDSVNHNQQDMKLQIVYEWFNLSDNESL